ncbi:MAG: hypothetical protein WCS09_15260 [Pseudomonadota bacterium]
MMPTHVMPIHACDTSCTRPVTGAVPETGARPDSSVPSRGRSGRFLRAFLAAALAGSSMAQAQWIESGDQLRISYAPQAIHFNPSPEHVDHNHLVAAELLTRRWTFWRADRSLVGLALFDNSFGQFSQYAYFGQEWDLRQFAGGRFYANVTAGLLHGYKEPFENKIPLNQLGIAPAIVPTAGWRTGRLNVSVTLLGANAIIVGGGWTFGGR